MKPSLICPKCPPARRTQFSRPGEANDICEVHGWVESIEMTRATDAEALAAVREAASWVGDGTASRPWDTDKLVELAKAVRRL